VTHRLVHCGGCNVFRMLGWESWNGLCQTYLAAPAMGAYHREKAMSTLKTSWETWHPKTRQDREEILQEMEEVLASAHFCNSKRYPALLRYVVESALSGNGELLKERTLGVEIFHRPPDYDTNTDTVVRYTAGEVRKRLSLYYHDHESRLQISLPAGSYVPEFLCNPEETGPQIALPQTGNARPDALQMASAAFENTTAEALVGTATTVQTLAHPIPFATNRKSHIRWLTISFAALLLAFGAIGWQRWHAHQQTALQQFWAPVLSESATTLICSGGVVFAPERFSGVKTAGRDIEYPFVSMQIATSIAHISGQLERLGETVQMSSSASTVLTEMRERPVVLIGGYNNDWTMRLLEPLRFRFAPGPAEIIADRDHPAAKWERDPALPYSSADDYALVARFHDATTGGIIVIVAGIGRNGTEAAAQFVTSPRYMEELRKHVGASLADRNIEAVLKINVIQGKTGAPSIEAVDVW
jgi:hypothetical protein